jgi:predicted dehydrogenase
MSLNPPVKIALIGAGNRSSTTYAPIFEFVRPWIELVAVCDPVQEHADALSDRLDVPAFYSLADLVKARPMEAALIVAPIDLHHGISVFLMEHGIHVHCETSMCSLLAQARDMVATAKQNNVILRIAENFIRYPFDRIAKKIDESGFIGPVHRILSLYDHTGYHNNSRWLHFMGSYPESAQAIKHTMPTVPYNESAHRHHTTENFRAHFYTFPGNRMVIDLAGNIKGLLGRMPRPGYTEFDGERGAIVRMATDQSDPNRPWASEAEVRYVSDEALATKAAADMIFPIVHEAQDDIWSRIYVDLPIGRVEYVNPYRMTPDSNVNHAHRNYYSVAIADHLIDFAETVRGVKQSEYTDEDALKAMEMEVAVRESAIRNGELIHLPLEGELASEEKMRAELRAKNGVDPLDVEGMIGVKVARP